MKRINVIDHHNAPLPRRRLSIMLPALAVIVSGAAVFWFAAQFFEDCTNLPNLFTICVIR